MKITTYPQRISDLINHYKKQKKDVDDDLKKRGAFENEEFEESTELGILMGSNDIYSGVIEDLEKIIK